jgi:hypothetical protein
MITLLGIIVFATVIAIGLVDRNSGLSLMQMYGSARDGSEPAPGGPERSHRDQRS